MRSTYSNSRPTSNSTSTQTSLKETTPNILIYANGSCLKNGSKEAQAGAGVVIIDEARLQIKLKASYLGSLTNQKAEILACTIGLESLHYPRRVQIFSDSKYVIETMLGLNQMRSNIIYWKRLINACLTHQIQWNWVKGKSGNAFQETAGKLSRAAATAKNDLGKNTLDRLALMMIDKPDKETMHLIHNGLRTLSKFCDGAKKADGIGFNKQDSDLGKLFAEKPILTEQEVLAAKEMLAKYRYQIAKFDKELALLV